MKWERPDADIDPQMNEYRQLNRSRTLRSLVVYTKARTQRTDFYLKALGVEGAYKFDFRNANKHLAEARANKHTIDNEKVGMRSEERKKGEGEGKNRTHDKVPGHRE
jgi:hypothetical protein